MIRQGRDARDAQQGEVVVEDLLPVVGEVGRPVAHGSSRPPIGGALRSGYQPTAALTRAPGQRLFGLAAAAMRLVRAMPVGYGLAFVLAAVSIVGFTALALASTRGTWREANEDALWYFHRTASPELDRLAVALTYLGNPVGTTAVAALFILGYLARRRYLDAATLLGSVDNGRAGPPPLRERAWRRLSRVASSPAILTRLLAADRFVQSRLQTTGRDLWLAKYRQARNRIGRLIRP